MSLLVKHLICIRNGSDPVINIFICESDFVMNRDFTQTIIDPDPEQTTSEQE